MATHTKTQTKSKAKNAAKTSETTNGSNSSLVRKYKMYINGEFVEGSRGKSFPVYDPSTEQIIAQVPEADERDVNRAVAAARVAFNLVPMAADYREDRGRTLFRLAERFRKEAATLPSSNVASRKAHRRSRIRHRRCRHLSRILRRHGH